MKDFFYKREILLLLKPLDELYNRIHNILMERKIQLRLAVVIYWDSLMQLFCEEDLQVL